MKRKMWMRKKTRKKKKKLFKMFSQILKGKNCISNDNFEGKISFFASF